MASVTMSATFLSGAALARRPSLAAPRRSLFVTASKTGGAQTEEKREADNGRREMMFAAAAAAVCSFASMAVAEEPARGTKEAKKAYAPVCVTMPTARICHK